MTTTRMSIARRSFRGIAVAAIAGATVTLSPAVASADAGGGVTTSTVAAVPAAAPNGAAQVAVNTALAQRGDMYLYGATGPDRFDCSGLTQFAWAAAGVHLTHYTGAQWNEGRSVSRSEARPGDLVFFYGDLHHVGMYVGNGIMVHAPSAGSPVRMAPIDQMPVAGFKRVG